MGILRTDRVSGLGGANAIKGSVFFNKQPSSFLRTNIDYLYFREHGILVRKNG